MVANQPIKIYKDKELKEEIKDLFFGKVEAGKTKTLTVYLINDSRGILENISISFPESKDKQIKVIKIPNILKQGEVGSLILQWTPSTEFKKGLRTKIQIHGEEVFYA